MAFNRLRNINTFYFTETKLKVVNYCSKFAINVQQRQIFCYNMSFEGYCISKRRGRVTLRVREKKNQVILSFWGGPPGGGGR